MEVDEGKERMADDYFYRSLKPKVFWGPDGVEAQMDKDFETSCVIMGQRVPAITPKQTTTMEYYSILEELKKQTEREKEINRKSGRR